MNSPNPFPVSLRFGVMAVALAILVIGVAILSQRLGKTPAVLDGRPTSSEAEKKVSSVPFLSVSGVVIDGEKPSPSATKLDGVPYTPPPDALANRGEVSTLRPTPEAPPAVVRQEAPATELPSRPAKKLPPNSKHLGSTERAERLLELQKEAAAETDPRVSQRVLLTVAGYHVGDDDWDKAKEIYDQLKLSPFPEIRHATARNLDVVERNQAILAEKDAGRREWLELELAGVHQQYGHEKFSKTLYRALEKDATQPAVRQQAAQRLASYVSPPLILPQPVQPKEDTQ